MSPNRDALSRQAVSPIRERAASAARVLIDRHRGSPGGVNSLIWFDSFLNYASSVAGDTVQVLP